MENGGCGYVLKPMIMKDELFVPGEKMPTAPQVSCKENIERRKLCTTFFRQILLNKVSKIFSFRFCI